MNTELQTYINNLEAKGPVGLCIEIRKHFYSSLHNLTSVCVNDYDAFNRIMDKIAEIDKDLEKTIVHQVMCNMAGIG